MVLHLVKLCVGVESANHLAKLQKARRVKRQQAGQSDNPFHITRMMPRRGEELLNGGSLFWVIKGAIMVRQNILQLERITTDDGIKRCRIMLDPQLIATQVQPRRPFQGWRYLDAIDAPTDIDKTKTAKNLPQNLEAELRKLGAW